MPNHVTNQITASPKVLQSIRETLKGHESGVDFNRLIPMPESMRGEMSDPAMIGRARVMLDGRLLKQALQRSAGEPRDASGIDVALQSLRDGNLLRDVLNSDRQPIEYSDEDFERFVGYMRSLRATGMKYADWYEWSPVNWGTKWNAYSVNVSTDMVEFNTAWSCPNPVVRKLAEVVPGPWHWDYADEDIGNNCGTWACDQSGVVAHRVPTDPVRFGCRITGRDYEEYMNDTE